jgi:hypothetical protein
VCDLETTGAPSIFKVKLQPWQSPIFVVYYEEIKREVNRILIYECRCDKRLRAKAEGSTRLACSGLRRSPDRLGNRCLSLSDKARAK